MNKFLSTKSWWARWDSNPHGQNPTVFETALSTNSNTRPKENGAKGGT